MNPLASFILDIASAYTMEGIECIRSRIAEAVAEQKLDLVEESSLSLICAIAESAINWRCVAFTMTNKLHDLAEKTTPQKPIPNTQDRGDFEK